MINTAVLGSPDTMKLNDHFSGINMTHWITGCQAQGLNSHALTQ